MPTSITPGIAQIISAENRSRLGASSRSRRRLSRRLHRSHRRGGAHDDEIRTEHDSSARPGRKSKGTQRAGSSPSAPSRPHLVERILRDYVSDHFTGIWIDNEEEYGKIVEFVSRFQPKLVQQVKLYTKETPIFEEFPCCNGQNLLAVAPPPCQ